jgi:hypothetical protein
MANELEIATTYIPHLKNQFTRGTAILFTGAGFSLSAFNVAGQHLLSTGQLIRELWNICYPGIPFDETTSLKDIYDAALQTNKRALERVIKESFTVNPKKCPTFYFDILTMPWARIYTLNVDDLAEKIQEDQRSGRPTKTVSATSGQFAEVQEGSLSIIHLNGTLDDVPSNVTFGRSQYALRHAPDSFYDLLRHDLSSRPVVFIGSTLEENSLWQHVEMRGPGPARGERELRPRSYLVTPSLNRSKQALLSRYNVEWLAMHAEEFRDVFINVMGNERASGHALLAQRYTERNKVGPSIVRISGLSPASPEPTEYLLGAEPEWTDAQSKRIAYRTCFDELIAEVIRIRSGTTSKQFLIVTGTAGTGKSSAMMVVALRLEAEGISSAWINGSERFDPAGFRVALEREPALEALFISDADLWERRLSRAIRDALDTYPRLVIICECRSSKIDRIVSREELFGVEPVEYTIPYLGDSDIEAILDVLDRENRLGVLKGQSREARRRIFQAEAGRQMLVAMYKATHGKEFKEKAVEEINELDATQQFVYGLVCVAHAHRFFLSRDELAIAFGDDIDHWPRALDALTRRKLLLVGAGSSIKARHREIAQFIYDEMNRQGTISDVIRAILRIAGTKTSVSGNPNSRPARMLATFANHTLIKRTAGSTAGRQIYSEFEYLLSWNYHYWLHRGALELETGNLAVAENFLRQAKALEPSDIFIDNELAYLSFCKANEAPYSTESEQMVKDAIDTFDAIAARRPDQRPHVYHVMGNQGLIWSRKARMSPSERKDFLGKLHRNVANMLADDIEGMFKQLDEDLRREILSIAVNRTP